MPRKGKLEIGSKHEDQSFGKHKEQVSSKTEPEKPLKLKSEMHCLTISDEAKKMVLDTLKFIHGEEFTIKNLSSYIDKGMNLNAKYWMDHGQLIIKAVENYSIKPKKFVSAHEKIKMFALEKLEKYGFYSEHCSEALDHELGDVGAAFELLMSKYFDISLPDPSENVDERILEERNLELDSLKSIYEDSFEEKIPNRLWVAHLDLQYLVEHYLDRTNRNKLGSVKNSNNSGGVNNSDRTKDKELCRFFIKGACRFGNTCRYSHSIPSTSNNETAKKNGLHGDNDSSLSYKCQLEFRFPPGCKYPDEQMLVSFVSEKCALPSLACLRLTDHMLRLSRKSAEEDGVPCVFNLIDFIQNHPDEVLQIADNKATRFLNPAERLFPTEVQDEEQDHIQPAPESVRINNGGRNKARESVNEQVLIRENDELCKKFTRKFHDSRYKNMLSSRQQLPAWSKMKELLDTLSENQVVIVSGETGCGKSTQVPQFILDDWLSNRKLGGNSHLNIVCTQPRRLSTLGVAGRIADERVERVGSTVGYQIRLENKMSSCTRLLFCTTGILLRRFETDPLLKSVTHIIVDEVHERSEESDFLLMLLKELLNIRRDLKVVLMSATLNADLFNRYFNCVPVIDIPGRTFPVTCLHLEDAMELTSYVLEEDSEYARFMPKKSGGKSNPLASLDDLRAELEVCDVKISSAPVSPEKKDEFLTLTELSSRYSGYTKQTCKNLYLMDHTKINYELIENVIMWIILGEHDYPKTGSILVFLPGLSEIITLLDKLNENAIFNSSSNRFNIIPLHSSLTNEEQALVFKKQEKGVRKIILSTNIAETSITIDDCVFVIDTGKMKEKEFDSNKNMESLETVWVSKANARQRRGRAGRVMAGVCFHMYTSFRMDYQLLPQPIPEIHRVPLEQLIIRIKMIPTFSQQLLNHILGNLIEPPKSDNVNGALVRLQAVGALDKENRLTPLGRHLGSLPVDVRIGKLILYGAIFCCLDSALTIAACLSYKSPFVTPFRKKEMADNKRKEFTNSKSDQLTVLKAFNAWRVKREKSRMEGNRFAAEHFMSTHTLATLVDIKGQFLQLLTNIGFVDLADTNCRSSSFSNNQGLDYTFKLTGPELNVNGNNNRLLISILCAALYPNIVKVLTPQKFYPLSMCGAVPKVPDPEDIKFKTKSDGYVNIHPSSVNYNVADFSSPYLVFQEKVKTSRIFIRDCSMVPVLPLVLFSSSLLTVELHSGTFVISLEEGWIMLKTQSNEVAELLQAMQIELFKLLEEKIEDPHLCLLNYPKGKKIINTIITLVSW